MSNVTISNLPVATALTGAEFVEIVQSGVSERTTTQAIANLYQGGTGPVVTSLSGGSTGLLPSIPATGAVTLSGIVNVANGGTGTSTPGLVSGSNVTITGAWPNQTISATGGVSSFSGGSTGLLPSSPTSGAVSLSGTLSVANGGTGTSTPGLVSGSNVTITGAWPNQTISASGGGGSPGGVSGQVQYNNAAAFGGVSGVTSGGSGMSFAVGALTHVGTSTGGTTINSGQTGSTSNTLTLPTTASDTLAGLGTAQTFTAAQAFSSTLSVSTAGALSQAAVTLSGAPVTGGTGTTTYPYFYLNSGSTQPTTLNTSGTVLGINAPSGFGGSLIAAFTNGASAAFQVSAVGNVTASSYQAAGGSSFNWVGRGGLTSPAAGAVQLGLADAAAPVAQTLYAQSVVGGTSNTAGQNFTIVGSRGTGTGAGGSIIFQTSPVNTTGTTQNAGVAALTIAAGTAAALAGSTTVNGLLLTAVATTASGSTITPTAGVANQYNVTALAAAATLAIPSGTPSDGQKLMIRIKDNGTAQALTWTTSAGGYRAQGVTLPTTTVISTPLYVGCIYNAQDSFWDVVAVS